MTDLSLIGDVSQSWTSYNVHNYDNLQYFSHFEQVSTDTYDVDYSYQDINGSLFVPSLYQSLDPTQFFPEFYYLVVPQVTATELAGATYYQYDYFYYPVYSTHAYASYDTVSTTVSSSTSYLEYSDDISPSMEPNSATDINDIDAQFSNSFYENSHPPNNGQIYTDNYYYDPNVGISGDSQIASHSYAPYDSVSTTVCSSTSYLEYSENISPSMEPNSATDINYIDAQFSNSFYENSHPPNNSRIYTDNYYYDPNVGISGDSQIAPDSYASYDNVSTTVSSSTSYLEYSENISPSMEPNSATDINYIDAQFSNSFYENSHPPNNSQIYTDNYYYDPNVGISEYSQIHNLITVDNSSGFSGDRSSLEESNIQNEIDPIAQLKFLKDRLYIIALSGKLHLLDSVPVVDVLPTIEEELNFIEDDGEAQIPVEKLEMDEHNSVPLENLNCDNEIKILDWTVEVEDETSVENEVNENLNGDDEIKVLDWTIELDEDVCKQGYDDNFFKAENSSSPDEINEYDSKTLTEYHKEQLYIWALSGYMNLKDEVPRVDILPVIEEEANYLRDDRESGLADGYNKEQQPELLGSCEIRDPVIIETNSKDSIEDFGSTNLAESKEKTKHDETGFCFNADKSTTELPFYPEKECVKSAKNSEKINLISSSKDNYTNRILSKEKEEIEEPLYEDPPIAPFYDVDLNQSDIEFYPESTIKNEEENPCKVKKKRFERIRNWFRSLCCVRNKTT